MIRALRVLAVLIGCFAALPASAQSLEQLFADAQSAGVRGDTTAALQGYERLEAAGVADPDVAYNRGLLHAQRGEAGRAILYFERSLRLRPGDADATQALTLVQTSLAEARAEAEGEATLNENPELVAPLIRRMPEPVLAGLVLLFELLFFGAWLLRRRQRSPQTQRLLGAVAAVGALAFVLAGAALLLHRGAFDEGQPAVVLDDHVPLREGPDPRAQQRAEAREGAHGVVLGTEGNHLRVRLVDGSEGWVERQSIGRI